MNDLYIITGATGGMGLDAAKHFAGKGKLLLLDVSIDRLNAVKSELTGEIDVLKFDITLDQDLDKLVEYVKKQGGFKHLLHFAGVSESMQNSELIYKINLIGTKRLLAALYDYAQKGGSLTLTASITAHTTPASKDIIELLKEPTKEDFLPKILPLTENTSIAYGWSKLGVSQIPKLEVSKWGQKDVRINSISPGAIKTPMVEKEMEKNRALIEQLIAATPAKRIGLPEDITNLVAFLASEKASFITGADIIIDGGITPVMS
ncbi:MAG: SDR family oxidoreductase [Acholeplasmataceae bacterium]|jgi:NAD(P)-dependent dehydrogenase (short-subunit alcohol dehydrogenase family)|nr:SDR family oxidoreductase [Acholeplasmataceae bacterium]